ncbi:MAG: FecR family protein [Pseudobacter sp.]|uniref:FecR family protein n=1 Tax=Pseudobacter sp. TaxID=2045420 RepID=UPI003F7EED4C
MNLPEKIAALIFKEFSEPLSAEENSALADWLDVSASHRFFYDQLQDEQQLRDYFLRFQNKERERSEDRVLLRLESLLFEQETAVVKGNFLRKWWLAASVILVLGIAGYLWNQSGKIPDKELVAEPEKNDTILPGSQGAVLTLSDGKQVVLDSLGNGIVAEQKGARAVLNNGQLSYDIDKGVSDKVAYNTMSTPKGRQFQVKLPDGTQVWLNAASSIRYPTRFSGSERCVQVTGEVYFEVAADSRKPFFVRINGTETIEVLGTNFNVNAYNDETAVRVTLLQGVVRVRNEIGTAMLEPGKQAVIAHDVRKIKVSSGINIVAVMAWKNAVFAFSGNSVGELMRQIARWYDVEIVYRSGVPPARTLGGEIGRNLGLLQVIEGLQEMGLECKLEGRKLIVGP